MKLTIPKLILLVVVIGCLFGFKIAHADTTNSFDGRPYSLGYFTGSPALGNSWVFEPTNVAPYDGLGPGCDTLCTLNLQSFIQVFQTRLNDTNNGNPNALSEMDQGRAAALIDIMLGVPGSNFGPGEPTVDEGGQTQIPAGIAYAKAHFQAWVNLITIYADGSDPGYSVNFNEYDYFPDGTNGMGMQAHGATGVGIEDCSNGAGDGSNVEGCYGDVELLTGFAASGYDYAVAFHMPDGKVFYIKHKCANLTDDTYGLETPPTPNPVTYTCGNATTSPTVVQPADTFTATVSEGYSDGSPGNTYFVVSIPSIGYTNPSAVPTVTANSLSYTTAQLRAPPAAGTYAVTYQLYQSDGTPLGTQCDETMNVVDLPYFQASGADVSSGGDFGSCTSTGGTLAGWYDSQTAKAGADSFFAAIALGQEVGFASGQGTTEGNPTGSPNGLSFANTTPVSGTSPSATIGGNYGGTHCLFTPVVPADATVNGATSYTVGTAPLSNATVTDTNNVSLTGGTVAAGTNDALYVTGNVYIGSNVIYGTNADGSWTINTDGTSNIPSFVLVVTGGNIYIDPNVTELDGTYVAEAKNGVGGTIFTCGQANYSPVATADLYSCNKQLTIYGSFVADSVSLMRTYGTLNNATSTENPNSGALKACTNGSAKSTTCAAESFDFSPEMFLSTPGFRQPDNGANTYDSITSLPPIL
jgi:hypothetical protein